MTILEHYTTAGSANPEWLRAMVAIETEGERLATAPQPVPVEEAA